MSDIYGFYDFSDSEAPYPDDSTDYSAPYTPHEVLKRYWGYDGFRPMQAEIIDSVMSGHDTFGLLPTGGGKSITFQVPALLLPGITIVVTPLVSLMKDQVDNLRRRGIRAVYLQSGMTRTESNYAYEKCASGRAKLLYVAPERLASTTFRNRIASWEVSLVVVDEAHCISQWGYDFRPSYLNIGTLREQFPSAPILALTASATPQVVDDIVKQLDMRAVRHFALSFARNNISFLVRETLNKTDKLIQILSATQGATIIYTRNRSKAENLAQLLSEQGFEALCYHAGLAPQLKNERQELWHSGQIRIMVATTAFGMGIDKPDVRLVVHIDPPSTLEEYYQEAGRAGRDGQPSLAVTVTSKHDKATLHRRLTKAFPDIDFIRTVYDEICRYLSLPMGEGFGALFDFMPKDMCLRYNIPLDLTMSAIGILHNAGYFEFTDEVTIETKIMINLSRDELYSCEFSGDEEILVTTLLRIYGGLFTDLVSVNETFLANRAGLPFDKVREILKKLRREDIITYIPRRCTPYLLFTRNRVPSSEIKLPHSVYTFRKEQMRLQLQAMENFLFDTSQCRVAGMLRYFGENSPADCGKCDVCRSRKSQQQTFDPAAFERRLDSFFETIAPETWLDTRSLEPHFKGIFPQVAQHIHKMIADGKLQSKDFYIAKT